MRKHFGTYQDKTGKYPIIYIHGNQQSCIGEVYNTSEEAMQRTGRLNETVNAMRKAKVL